MNSSFNIYNPYQYENCEGDSSMNSILLFLLRACVFVLDKDKGFCFVLFDIFRFVIIGYKLICPEHSHYFTTGFCVKERQKW